MSDLPPVPPPPEPLVEPELDESPAQRPEPSKVKQWSFYRASDGVFASRRITTNDVEALKRDTPAGCVAIEGRYDRHRQRVDLATGDVIVDESLGTERDQERRRSAAQQQIVDLEQRQHRRVRELLEDSDPRLKQIGQQIAQLRASLGD